MAAADLPSEEYSMSSRTFRRSTVLAFALSLGVCSIPSAEAAQAGSRIGSAFWEELSLRTFVQNVIFSLRSLSVTKSDPPPPNNPGGSPPPGSGGREGSVGCPVGRPPGPPPPGR